MTSNNEKFELVGQGVTKRKRRAKHSIPSGDDETDMAKLNNWAASMKVHLADPWKDIERQLPALQQCLDAERQKKRDAEYQGQETSANGGSYPSFQERDELGWYYQFLIREIKQVRANIESGDAGNAAFYALQVGEAFSELQMKVTWEKDAMSGRKSYNGGGASRDMRAVEHNPKYKSFVFEYEQRLKDGKSELLARQNAAEKVGIEPKTARNYRKKYLEMKGEIPI
jgi:hypothetical protein